MGYESKLFVVKKGWLEDEFNGKTYRWGERIASIDLSCAPLVAHRFGNAKESNVFWTEGEVDVIEDMYGTPFKELPIDKAIEVLEDANEEYLAEGNALPYRRYTPAIALLKAFKAGQDAGQWDDDLVVIHFGH